MASRVSASSAAFIAKGYLQLVARSASCRVGLDTGSSIEMLSPGGTASTVAELLGSPPTVFPLWNAHSLLLLTFYLGHTAVRNQSAYFQAVADDSFGGLLTGQLFRQCGIQWRQISYISPAKRLEDLKGLMRDRPHVIIAADSHGPYRAIGPGMARLVKSYNGYVRPISLRCNKTLSLFRHIRMALPLPRSSIITVIGRPLELETAHLSVLQIRECLESCLQNLELRTKAVHVPEA